MALWLVRAGVHGENEKKFLDEARIYLTWDGLSNDLGDLKDHNELRDLLKETYPDAPAGRIRNHLGQIWAFGKSMQAGDWVLMPSKQKPAVHVAEMKGDYTFDPTATDPFFHYRDVEWITQDIPRSNFDQDLLYSFGSSRAIYEVSRNDAEKRIRQMARSGWKPSTGILSVVPESEDEDSTEREGLEDIALAARDQLAKFVIAKFKGRGMERLVDAVLRAQGYKTYLSPVGSDKGVDILASPGPMGYAKPRICVQVKSGDSALERPTLDQLIGAMKNVRASHGLLVSWGGFKRSIDQEEMTQFFHVRLWDQDDLIDQILFHYDELDADIRGELPLKRIWIVVPPEE